MNEGFMKKAKRLTDDLLPEYDFAAMKGGVRGKYVKKYRAGTNLVLLEPELAKAFPTDAAVNEVLRAALSMTRIIGRTQKALHPTHHKTAGD